MHTSTPTPSHQGTPGTPSPSPQDGTKSPEWMSTEYLLSVSAESHKTLTDDEREDHIRDCGLLMQGAMQRWHDFGCMADRGEADRWRLAMEEAIRGRSPAQVARMERERGLA